MCNEKTTDQFVRDLLRSIDVKKPWEQDGGPKWKRDALAGGSKSKNGKGEGKPEFVFVVGNFIVIIEDKKEVRLTRFLEDGQVTTEFPYRQDYALNGAVHYASAMLRSDKAPHKAIFAVGIGGEPHFKPIVTAFENWHEEIFSYFDHSITNAYTESLNSLIRVINRNGRGYSFEALRAKVLYTEGTHRIAKPAHRAVTRKPPPGGASFETGIALPEIDIPKARNYGAFIPSVVEMLEQDAKR
jgi:hypothetical protein